MLLRLIFLVDVLTCKAGSDLRIPISDEASPEAIDTLIDNLRMGSLQTHCEVKVRSQGQRVELLAKYDCECFGAPAEKGDAVFSFDMPGDINARRAFGEALRTGQLDGKVEWSVTSLAEIAEQAEATRIKAEQAAKDADAAAAAAEQAAKDAAKDAAAAGSTQGAPGAAPLG